MAGGKEARHGSAILSDHHLRCAELDAGIVDSNCTAAAKA
jgi:hypothetical protein